MCRWPFICTRGFLLARDHVGPSTLLHYAQNPRDIRSFFGTTTTFGVLQCLTWLQQAEPSVARFTLSPTVPKYFSCNVASHVSVQRGRSFLYPRLQMLTQYHMQLHTIQPTYLLIQATCMWLQTNTPIRHPPAQEFLNHNLGPPWRKGKSVGHQRPELGV